VCKVSTHFISDGTGTGTGTVPGWNNVALVWPRNIFVSESNHAEH